MAEKAKEGTLKAVNGSGASGDAPKKRRRWDMTGSEEEGPTKKRAGGWDAAESAPATPSNSR